MSFTASHWSETLLYVADLSNSGTGFGILSSCGIRTYKLQNRTDGRNPWVFIPLLPIPAFSSLVSAIPANFYPCIFLSLHFHPCKHQSLQIAIPAFLSLQATIPANCYPWKNKSCNFSTLVSPNHQSQFYHSKTHPTTVSQSFQYITHT